MHERAGSARRATRPGRALLRERGIAAFVDAWQAQPLFATQARAARGSARRAARPPARPRSRAARAQPRDDGARRDAGLSARGGRRSIGVALIAGADDAKYVAIARALPAPLALIPESGHDPTLEQPARLAAALADLARRR